MGRVLMAADYDWAAVISNLRKAHKQWLQMSRILGWEDSNTRVLGLFYKSVVQAILIYM